MSEPHGLGCSHESAGLSRHVWIVNHYAAIPSKDGGAGRHLNLALELPKFGWTVSLIVASTLHPSGQQGLRGRRLRNLTTEQGVPALWVRTIAYRRSLPLRFLGMIVFALNLLRPGTTKGLRRPDAVIGSTVHPFAAWGGWRLAKRHGVRFIYEIRDVWPESLFDLARIGKHQPVSRLIAFINAALVRHADLVLSPLPFVDRHLAEIGSPDKPFLWVPNGHITPRDQPPELVDRVDGPFTFMYLGSFGRANALESVLEAFNEACTNSGDADLRLRLVGEGPLKDDLKSQADAYPSANRITFEDKIPEDEVICRAHEADCLVANMHDLPVYRFGVGLNKSYMYLAAGRPVVLGSSAPNCPIAEAGAGVVVPGDDSKAMSLAMLAIARQPSMERAEMALAGRKSLREHYTYDRLAEKLAHGLDSVAAGSPNRLPEGGGKGEEQSVFRSAR